MQNKTLTKEQYPFLLKNIPSLPQTMDILGSMPTDDNKFLCVIGARKNSPYGKEVCDKLIGGLRGCPIVIVSGLAIGIDSLAHRAALSANLKTVAFPGSGLSKNVLYPPSRIGLARDIVDAGGAIISPFEYEQKSTNWTFPSRNRLMAGMSHATLVIEARKGSGTLLTAEYATEFNRDILAVPGSIFSELSYGPHMLIERGAVPITTSEDIKQALGLHSDISSPNIRPEQYASLDSLSQHIIAITGRGEISKNEIAMEIGAPVHEINAKLSFLELHGLISLNGLIVRKM